MNFGVFHESLPGMILGLRPANERRRYFVTSSLISWVQAKNQSCLFLQKAHRSGHAVLHFNTNRW